MTLSQYHNDIENIYVHVYFVQRRVFPYRLSNENRISNCTGFAEFSSVFLYFSHQYFPKLVETDQLTIFIDEYMFILNCN